MENITNDYNDTDLSIENTQESIAHPEIKTKRQRKILEPVTPYYTPDINIFEIGIDEAGRGPLFGRVYAGAAILPKNDIFNYKLMKDSKKFTSTKKIMEAFEYIKENAICWAVEYEDEKTIDEINILQATQSAMHKCVKKILSTNPNLNPQNTHLLVDGNYFNTYTNYNNIRKKFETYKYTCVEGGDNKYASIAAASILAKVSRDLYIDELCKKHPELSERYCIDSNKGYGAKKHIQGIKDFGITEWHRKSFGICKNY